METLIEEEDNQAKDNLSVCLTFLANVSNFMESLIKVVDDDGGDVITFADSLLYVSMIASIIRI